MSDRQVSASGNLGIEDANALGLLIVIDQENRRAAKAQLKESGLIARNVKRSPLKPAPVAAKTLATALY